jgi:short-subunit dehydrogenase
MENPMRDKVIVITGASSGIGAELARQLAARGAKLVLASRNAAALQEVAQAVPGAYIVPTDVTREEDCRHLIEQSIAQFGRIDVLVNNAGISMSARFEDITDLSIFERLMQVNLLGSVYCTHAALPYLKSTHGLVVAVSSLTGKTGVPTRTAYAASKHAMQGFFDSLRIELMGTGVDVLVVSPGFVKTPVRERALGPDGKPIGKSHLGEHEKDMQSVEECARRIIGAMTAHKRELIMTARGRMGQWLKLIAPVVVDKIARDAVKSGRS